MYAFLGLAEVPPELREDRGEIEAARDGRLPRLVEEGDLQGDCHAHSDWSDGIHTIEQMAEAARAKGYGYLVLTDHSHGLAIARGLTPERVAAQRAVVNALNDRFAREEEAGTAPSATPPDGFRLLHGCELEIRADGSLDFDDELLASFDLVVAALHQGRRQPRAQLTARVLGAIRSPHVDVIAHPAGRMLGERARPDLDLDWDAIFDAAAATGTLLEIDGSDHRLDLSAERARLAVAAGCRLTIDSDAHRTEELAGIRWGVAQARRAWVEPDVVANTWSRARLLDWVAGTPGRVRVAGGLMPHVPGLPGPLRRSSPPLASGPPGHPLPPARRPPPRTPVPGPALKGAPGLPLGSAGAEHAPRAGDRGADPAWEAVVVAVVLATVGRLAEGPALWAAALLAGLALGLAALEVLGGGEEPAGEAELGVPVEALLLPAVTGIAAVTALHIVPVGLLLVPGLAAVGALAAASIEIERRILARPSGPTAADRTALLEPGRPPRLRRLHAASRRRSRAPSWSPCRPAPRPARPACRSRGWPSWRRSTAWSRACWATASTPSGRRRPRDALAAALSYAAVVAIAAAALRAMGLPRLLGPALLTLVLYLWSAYRGVPRTARRDIRWVWELLLLAGMGVAVVAWNLLAQG